MIHKLTIPVHKENIALRFDMATEVFIILLSDKFIIEEKKSIILPRSSAEELCHLILSENTNTLICGAIEDEYYQFLTWKKINIFDSVVGIWSEAFTNWKESNLKSGDILSSKVVEGRYV